MREQNLDEWFAAADDVLADWQGDVDAMRCQPSKGEQELPLADSYHQQELATQDVRRGYRSNEVAEPAGVIFVASLREACDLADALARQARALDYWVRADENTDRALDEGSRPAAPESVGGMSGELLNRDLSVVAEVSWIAMIATRENYGRCVHEVTSDGPDAALARLSSWPRMREAASALRKVGYEVEEDITGEGVWLRAARPSIEPVIE